MIIWSASVIYGCKRCLSDFFRIFLSIQLPTLFLDGKNILVNLHCAKTKKIFLSQCVSIPWYVLKKLYLLKILRRLCLIIFLHAKFNARSHPRNRHLLECQVHSLEHGCLRLNYLEFTLSFHSHFLSNCQALCVSVSMYFRVKIRFTWRFRLEKNMQDSVICIKKAIFIENITMCEKPQKKSHILFCDGCNPRSITTS